MIEKGLIDEVKSLLSSGVSKDAQSMQGIGYKEVVMALNGEITEDECIELIKKNSRNYAKRQLSWFGGDSRVNWIVYNKPESGDQVFREATEFLRQAGLQF